MKGLVFLFFVCVVSLMSVKAQTKERGFFVEVSASCGKDHIKTYATITPTIGYQFNQRWSAGMKVGFETATFPYKIYTPFVRFNVLRISELNLFTEAQLNILPRDIEGGQAGYNEAGLTFGLSYPFGRHLNLVGHYLFVGYSGKDGKKAVGWAMVISPLILI